jgi:hypothetical protein
MAISIDWGAKVINVPQGDLTPLGGSLYELDVDAFRLTLKDLEDDEAGIVFEDTHRHNTEATLSGTTFARQVELINGYTVTFQNGSYRVRLSGANNNITDVANLNSVSLLSTNSAGLIVGAGADPVDVAVAVWDRELKGSTHNIPTSAGRRLRQLNAASLAFEGEISGTPTATEIPLDSGASTENDFYRPGLVVIESSFGVQFARISAYDGGTKTLTLATPLTTVPANGNAVVIIPWASVRVSEVDASAGLLSLAKFLALK